MLFFRRTHKLGDGVSGHGSVANPVLPDGPLGVVPADGEGAGCGVKHAHVPGAGAGHCGGKRHVTLTSVSRLKHEHV